MSIRIADISKRFNGFTALDRISLDIRGREMVALLGPSGSGKTTLLRILAGLESADAGRVLFDGVDVAGSDARDRRVGFVFQHYALFRHMNVFDNIAFGLKVRPRGRRPSRADIRATVERLLALVQLPGLGHRFPSQISGGQRQRVALARALAIEPKVLLLDEPFGALDAQVRKELRRWLRTLHEEIGTTSVFVTHDQEEAFEIADRIVVMGHGKIEQIDSPQAIYERPANPFVYRFLGNVNALPCDVNGGKVSVRGMKVNGIGPVEVGSGAATIFVRPDDIEIRPSQASGSPVKFVSYAGSTVRLGVAPDAADAVVEIELTRQSFQELGLGVGSSVDLEIRRGRVFQ